MWKAVFDAISKVFGWLTERSQQHNRKDVRKRETVKENRKLINKFRKDIRSKRTKDIRRGLSILLALGLILLPSCGTVRGPAVKPPTEIAWDGGEQTAGFLGWTDDGWGILTIRAMDRFQALAVKHGAKFVPPLDPQAGIKHLDFEPPREDLFLLSPEQLEKFLTMSQWERSSIGEP